MHAMLDTIVISRNSEETRLKIIICHYSLRFNSIESDKLTCDKSLKRDVCQRNRALMEIR